jgi:solute carrier family 25 protein 38
VFYQLEKINCRNVPGSALYFFALSEIRQILATSRSTWQPMLNKVGVDGKITSEHQRWENLFSGSAARGAVGYVMMPITVVKVRYEVMTYMYDHGINFDSVSVYRVISIIIPV